MKTILDQIMMNDALFSMIILFLCLVLIAIILLIIKSMRNKKINIYEEDLEDEDIKKVKNVKKEDIIETPKSIKEVETIKEEISDLFENDEEEIEEEIVEEEISADLREKYEEEAKEEFEEVKENNTNSEIEKLLTQMEEDSKLKPEDVVANFEMEQEARSIISYQELVDAVKNRKDEYYEDELESKPLTKVSDFVRNEEDFEPNEAQEMIDNIISNTRDLKDELEDTKFKKSEIISPIYGRIEDTNEVTFPKISKVKEEDLIKDETLDVMQEASLSALNDIYNHMADDLKKSNPELQNEEKLRRYTNNEEFLQSLKDFRKNL